MTLGVVMPEPRSAVQPVVQPTPLPQPVNQVSGAQFSHFINPENFGGNVRTRTLTSGNAELDAIFEAAGRRYNLSPDFLKAVAKVESNFRPDVTSRAGAMGIMQLMPGTARYLGVDDPFNAEQNIFGGARYLREQLDRFNGDIELALAAYNAGWPTVKRHGGIPPFRETQAYVQRVLGHLADSDILPSMLAISYNNSRGNHNFNHAGGVGNPFSIGSSGTANSYTPNYTPSYTPDYTSNYASSYISSYNSDYITDNSNNSENSSSYSAQPAFDYNEALVQLLVRKLMNMQAETEESEN